MLSLVLNPHVKKQVLVINSADYIGRNLILSIPRSWKRKTDGGVPLHPLNIASNDVTEQGKSIRSVAKLYGICHVMLCRFCKKRKKLLEKWSRELVLYHSGNRVFIDEQEQKLSEYLLRAADLCPLPSHLSSCLPGHLSSCLPGHLSSCLPGHLSSCLPGHFSSCLPGHLSSCLPGHFSSCLPGHFSSCLPGHFSSCLPGHLSSCLPGHFSSCLPGHFSSCLPGHLSSCLPGHFSSCLPGHLSSCLPGHLSSCLPGQLNA
ncbi:uncharacterized protein isoform X2 [Salmo salar]|uniref:Uncharacterized protein isoform X2 n=1 Tax=Salmo salar TaxID=8030 RepID=A0ABM3EIS3_SALSA|nr:uncharacterized protein LOC106600787 isoform X2 [Salmo salar]